MIRKGRIPSQPVITSRLQLRGFLPFTRIISHSFTSSASRGLGTTVPPELVGGSRWNPHHQQVPVLPMGHIELRMSLEVSTAAPCKSNDSDTVPSTDEVQVP